MTTIDLILALVLGGLFTAGCYLLLQRSLMRTLLGFMVLGHGTNLLLLAAGHSGEPPVLGGGDHGLERFADPLPQAMALTAIVITFGVTMLLLALGYRSWRLTGHDEVRDDVEDRRIASARERDDSDSPDTGEDGPTERDRP